MLYRHIYTRVEGMPCLSYTHKLKSTWHSPCWLLQANFLLWELWHLFNSPPEVPADRGWGWMTSMAQKTNGMQGSEGIAPGSHKSAQTFPLQNKPSHQEELQNYVNDTCKKNGGSQNNLAFKVRLSWTFGLAILVRSQLRHIPLLILQPECQALTRSGTSCQAPNGDFLHHLQRQPLTDPESFDLQINRISSLLQRCFTHWPCVIWSHAHAKHLTQSIFVSPSINHTKWCSINMSQSGVIKQTCQRHLLPTQLHNLHSSV